MLSQGRVLITMRSRMMGTGGALLLMLIGLIVVVSSGTAASQYSPSLERCPAWGIDATPNDGALGSILTSVSAVSSGEVWAAGSTIYERSGVDTYYKTLVMRWDGTEWKRVPTPNPDATNSYLNAVLAFSAQDVWVAGTAGGFSTPTPFLLHWDGQQWSNVALPQLDPSGNEIYALSGTGPQDIWAVGSIGCGRCKTEHSLVLHYNGIDWQTMAASSGAYADALFAVSALSPTEVWFAGYQSTDRGAQPLMFRNTGSGIEKVDIPRATNRQGLLWGIDSLSAGDAWAVGYSVTGSAAAQKRRLLAYHYDGSNWVEAEIPTPSEEGGALYSVAGHDPNNIWAVGYMIASTEPRSLVMHYDGTNWTQADAPNPGTQSSFNAAAVTSSGDFIAAGYQRPSDDAAAITLLERYADNCAEPPTSTATANIPQPTATSVSVTQLPGSTTRTFPETGKTVSGIFLEYWDANGGLAQQGYPISGPIGEVSDLDGKPYSVQYFERSVFEYHPENEAPFNVLLSQLGTFRYQEKYPDGAPGQVANNSEGSVLFPETGNRVGGRFLKYWQENGGLVQQGYPISNEFQERSDLDGKIYTVQYFERAVFEMHPENEAPYDVLLSQLGTFRYKTQYEGQDQQATPEPTQIAQPTPSQPTPTVAAQPTSTGNDEGPCADLPASDPEIVVLTTLCVPRGKVVRLGLNDADAAVSVTLFDASNNMIGQPSSFNPNVPRAVYEVGTGDLGPGIYKLVFEGYDSHRKWIAYFKVYHPEQ